MTAPLSRLGQDLGKTWALPEADTPRHTRAPLLGARVSLSRGRLGHRQDLGGHARHRPRERISRRKVLLVGVLLGIMRLSHRLLRWAAVRVDEIEGRLS